MRQRKRLLQPRRQIEIILVSVAVTTSVALALSAVFRSLRLPEFPAPLLWRADDQSTSLEATTSLSGFSRFIFNSAPADPPMRQQHDAFLNQSSYGYRSPLEEFLPPLSFNSSSYQRSKSSRRPPFDIIQQYIDWHSIDALKRDPHNRRFLVAHYRCPLSAGNRIHEFTSAFLWAILTNRTLLYKYFDREECLRVRNSWNWRFRNEQCEASNTEHDCHRILLRAPWIPGFDEFAGQFNLSIQKKSLKGILLGENASKTVSDTFTSNIHYNHHVDYRATSNYFNKDPIDLSLDRSLDHKDPVLISVRPWPKRLDYLFFEHNVRRQQLKTTYARNTLYHLSEWAGRANLPFLFGLLFRYAFDWAPALQEYYHRTVAQSKATADASAFAGGTQASSPVFTFAVHSRHIFLKLSGNDTTLERDCVLNLLRQRSKHPIFGRDEPHRREKGSIETGIQPSTGPCRAVLLSDRRETIQNLSDWLRNDVGCEVFSANQEEGVCEHESSCGSKWTDQGQNLTSWQDKTAMEIHKNFTAFQEHGPYSGIGFFRDLVLAAALVRDGMVGELEGQPQFHYHRWRSSSELIEEVIAYYRTMEAWSKHGAGIESPKHLLPELLECTLVHEPDDPNAMGGLETETSGANRVASLRLVDMDANMNSHGNGTWKHAKAA